MTSNSLNKNWHKTWCFGVQGEIVLWILRDSLGRSRWFAGNKSLQTKIHAAWMLNFINRWVSMGFPHISFFSCKCWDLEPLCAHISPRKHVRSFNDYQVGDRVDAKSETGVPRFWTSGWTFLIFHPCFDYLQFGIGVLFRGEAVSKWESKWWIHMIGQRKYFKKTGTCVLPYYIRTRNT